MRLANLIDVEFQTAVTVNAATSTTAIDITGCERIAIQIKVTNASSPNTASAVIEGSLDNSVWHTMIASQNITDNGNFKYTLEAPVYKYARVTYAIASGSFKATSRLLGKGYQ